MITISPIVITVLPVVITIPPLVITVLTAVITVAPVMITTDPVVSAAAPLVIPPQSTRSQRASGLRGSAAGAALSGRDVRSPFLCCGGALDGFEDA
ncbi:MAG TPA: hypothetical protein VH087_11640 [Thermoanaerobaculia bacterium]|nr:hypothetical protein [Thermoanaerobaculia bacterium]